MWGPNQIEIKMMTQNPDPKSEDPKIPIQNWETQQNLTKWGPKIDRILRVAKTYERLFRKRE